MNTTIANWLAETIQRDRFVLSDGATGTELQRRGFELPAPLWSAAAITEAPQLLQNIHQDYLKAGAQILTANTFRTTPHVLRQSGQEHAAVELTQKAIAIAQQAIQSESYDAKLAVSIAPLEDCYSPDRVPNAAILAEDHARFVQILSQCEFDFVLLETQINLTECSIAADLLHQNQIPFALSCVTHPADPTALLSGEKLTDLWNNVLPLQPLWVGVNCVCLEQVPAILKCWKTYSRQHLSSPVRFGIYCNSHRMLANGQWESSQGESAEGYMEQAQSWLDQDVAIIGGCCGTTPTYTQQLKTLQFPNSI